MTCFCELRSKAEQAPYSMVDSKDPGWPPGFFPFFVFDLLVWAGLDFHAESLRLGRFAESFLGVSCGVFLILEERIWRN